MTGSAIKNKEPAGVDGEARGRKMAGLKVNRGRCRDAAAGNKPGAEANQGRCPRCCDSGRDFEDRRFGVRRDCGLWIERALPPHQRSVDVDFACHGLAFVASQQDGEGSFSAGADRYAGANPDVSIGVKRWDGNLAAIGNGPGTVIEGGARPGGVVAEMVAQGGERCGLRRGSR